MPTSSGKKGSPRGGKVEVTYFQKPPDRTKTVLETPIVPASDTLREMRVPSVAKVSGVTTAPPKKRSKERRRTTELELEIPEHARAGKGDRPGPDGIIRHGAKTLGKQQIAEMALFGHHLFESGRTTEAKAVFEGLVELGVEDAFPHTMLGIIYLADGAEDRALALFEAALALDPKDLASRVYRAELQLGQGKTKAAVRELESVVEQTQPSNPFGERARKLLSEANDGGAARRKKR